MTVPAESLSSTIDMTSRSYSPDRQILSRRDVKALSLILELITPQIPRAGTRDMDCSEVHVFGDCYIDVHSMKVYRDGDPVHLSRLEYHLLLALAERDGAPASSKALIAEVWGSELDMRSRSLSQHVHALRRKLERNPAAPKHIKTVIKVGYRLDGASRTVRTCRTFDSNR